MFGSKVIGVITVLWCTCPVHAEIASFRACQSQVVRIELTELLVEGVLTSDMVITPASAIPLSSDMKAVLAEGSMEIRLRMVYREDSRTLRITQYIAARGDVMPQREGPGERSGSVLQMLDVDVESVRSGSEDGSLTILGTIIEQPVPRSGERVVGAPTVSVHLRFEQPGETRFQGVTMAYSGSAAVAPVASGRVVTRSVREDLPLMSPNAVRCQPTYQVVDPTRQ